MTEASSDSTRKPQAAPAAVVTPEPSNDLVLTTEQNWASKSHHELYESVHRNNDPGQTGEIGSEWARFGTGLSESARIINEGVAATESGWTGVSADKARTAINLLAQWVTETARKATELGDRVQEQSRIMETARAAMPEPVEFDWNDAAGKLGKPGIADFAASAADVQAANEKSRAAHEQAVTVMKTMEQQSRAVDETTPRFTAPFNPATGKVEELQPTTSHFAGAPSSGASSLRSQVDEESGEVPTQGDGSTPDGGSPQQTEAAFAGAAGGGPVGPCATGLPEHNTQTGQNLPGQGGTAAAAAAAVAPGTYAPHGGGHLPDESGKQARPGAPVQPIGFPVAPGAKPSLGTTSKSGGRQPAKMTPQEPGAPKQGFRPTGTKPLSPAAGFGGAGGVGGAGGTGGGQRAADMGGNSASPVRSTPPPATGTGGDGGGRPVSPGGGGGGRPGGGGGSGGFGGMSGLAKSLPHDGDITLRPGGATGLMPSGDKPGSTSAFAPNTTGVVGAPAGKADGTPMGGAPPMGGGAKSPGAEDTEHKSAYVQSEDIFDMPGGDLPPPVIGGGKSNQKGGKPS